MDGLPGAGGLRGTAGGCPPGVRRIGVWTRGARGAATWRAVAGAALTLFLPLAGCSTATPVADRTLASRPAHWIALVPRSLGATPAFTRLADARRQEYAVSVVEYDPLSGTPEQRLALIRSAMDAAESELNPGSTATGVISAEESVRGFVLIVGSPATVPMGPWIFEGAPEPILTDFALSAGLVPAAGQAHAPIAAAAWSAALERGPRWIVGRLPWDDAESMEASVEGTLAQMDGSTGGTGAALLGGTGAPQIWTLASARSALRHRAWEATLVGDGGSCDRRTAGDIRDEWSRVAPALVILAAPPGDPSTARPAAAERGVQARFTPGAGFRDLLPGASATRPSAQDHPALLVAYSSGLANPSDATFEALFLQGWVAGAIGFTHAVAPFPIGPSVRVAARLPADLADGAPMGVAVESARRRYWALSGSDVGIIVPGTDAWRARNALSLTSTGDPALRAIRSVEPPPRPTPVLAVTPAPTPAPTHSTPSDTGPAPTENAWALTAATKWLSLGALGLFFLAFALWMVTRRGGGPAA